MNECYVEAQRLDRKEEWGINAFLSKQFLSLLEAEDACPQMCYLSTALSDSSLVTLWEYYILGLGLFHLKFAFRHTMPKLFHPNVVV